MKEKFRNLQLEEEFINCPICKVNSSKFIIEEEHYQLKKCNNCKVFFVNPQPTIPSLAKLYSSSYFESVYEVYEVACMNYFSTYINEIGSLIEGRNILEIGPGSGYFMRVASSNGWNIIGLDISEDAAEKLRKQGGFEVITGTLDNTTLVSDTFDVVAMWDVLEHMKDPITALHSVQNLLVSNGLIVLKIPNSFGLRPLINRIITEKQAFYLIKKKLKLTNYFIDHGYHHLFHFNRSSIFIALDQSGFIIEEIKTVPEPVFKLKENKAKTIVRNVIQKLSKLTNTDEALLVYARKK